MTDQAEIHKIEMQSMEESLKKSNIKAEKLREERDSMANNVLEVNNLRVSIENDLKDMQKENRVQNVKFMDRLRAKDSEIALLTERLSTLESDAVQLEGQYKKEMSVLESHLRAQTKAAIAVKSEMEVTKHKLAKELDSTLLDSEASHAAMREDIESIKAQLEAKITELEELKEDRELDAAGFLNELEMEEVRAANAKKQWAAEEEKLKSEVNYWKVELENVRVEANNGIEELRDALMSQCEVHKKYEAEKESEISLLKTWLEEAQGDLEDIHKSKADELVALNESTLQLKAGLEDQLNEKSSQISTMLENIDALTKKCNK